MRWNSAVHYEDFITICGCYSGTGVSEVNHAFKVSWYTGCVGSLDSLVSRN